MKNCPACQSSYPNNFAVCPRDATALVEVGVWSEGTVIRGKYRILSKVGQGGMGAVYKALHVAFDEMRALKVMSPELLSDELFVKRFKHEAVITRKLQHPHAVRVDDIDEAEDGRPFIVMEYIEGQSLKKLIQQQGALPVPRVCSIIKQVAAALEAAHRLGMVHRDIKPDNIVLIETSQGEQAKVLDFGIAKIKESRASETSGMTLTGTGVVIGTPQYMSPEQAMGKRGDELDGRSDLYSLGIVMYQMLVGDLPFKADTTMGMLLAHMQTPPTPIRMLHPELQIPDAIASLVMRTLEKKRELRPPSAQALIEEISQAEKEAVPLGATRVLRPTTVVSPEAMQAAQAAARVGAAGAAVAPPAAAVQPRAAPAPRPASPVAAVATPAQPRSSPLGIVVVVGFLVVGLGGGAWYFTQHRSAVAPEIPAATSTPATTPAAAPATSVPSPTTSEAVPASLPAQPEVAPATSATGPPPAASTAASPARTAAASPVDSPPAPGRIKAAPPGASAPAKPVADSKEVSAAIAMGDLYLGRGEYDNAIGEYQRGLSVDPSNQKLRAKIENARKAKAAEERIQ